MELHREYLRLLGELTETLEQLSDIERQKSEAIRQDDLERLDAVIKTEQAQSLVLRGQEQKRARLLSRLGLEDMPLSGLAAAYPPELRLEAKNTVEGLQQQYQLFRSAADSVRSLLECNLHQIEKVLSGAQGTVVGPGYEPPAPAAAPPPPMKTDFRA